MNKVIHNVVSCICIGSPTELDFARRMRYYKVHGFASSPTVETMISSNIATYAKECKDKLWPLIIIKPDAVRSGMWAVLLFLSEGQDDISMAFRDAVLVAFKRVHGNAVRYFQVLSSTHIRINGLTVEEAESIAFRAFDGIMDIIEEIKGL